MPTDSTDSDAAAADRDAAKIADMVEAAPLDTISTGDVPDDVRDPGEIVAALLNGEMDPHEVDDAVIRWVNSQVDIPFIGEASESRLLHTFASVLKSGIVAVLRSL
jgi:hypothetical protein